jgi:hypothetical protein
MPEPTTDLPNDGSLILGSFLSILYALRAHTKVCDGTDLFESPQFLRGLDAARPGLIIVLKESLSAWRAHTLGCDDLSEDDPWYRDAMAVMEDARALMQTKISTVSDEEMRAMTVLQTFGFTFTLATDPIDSDEDYDSLGDALFKQGCFEDGSFGSSAGVAHIAFDREATDLAEAIGSALRQVHKAGYSVSRIEVDRHVGHGDDAPTV